MGIGQVNKLEKEAFREREMNFIIQLKAFQFVLFVVRIEQLQETAQKKVTKESHAPRLHIAHLKNVEKRGSEVQGKSRLSGEIS